MILAFDTYYFENKARTIAIEFENWTDEVPKKVHQFTTEDIAEYESGQFYKRELPCILDVLKPLDLSKIDIIVVDGFVYLDDDKKLGLGGYLYEALNKQIPIIGVAKNSFATINNLQRSLMRGESKKPLHITAVGMDLDFATECIKNMHGDYRFPTLLKLVDGYSRDLIEETK